MRRLSYYQITNVSYYYFLSYSINGLPFSFISLMDLCLGFNDTSFKGYLED